MMLRILCIYTLFSTSTIYCVEVFYAYFCEKCANVLHSKTMACNFLKWAVTKNVGSKPQLASFFIVTDKVQFTKESGKSRPVEKLDIEVTILKCIHPYIEVSHLWTWSPVGLLFWHNCPFAYITVRWLP